MKQIFSSISECANCADQASIAAPGQTTLCKTHSDEKHYANMNDFFESELENLEFCAHLPFCSSCGSDFAPYLGFIKNAIQHIVFSFCNDCRAKYILKQNAARAALERIGA